MYSTNEYYFFMGALDQKICNKIIREAKGKWEESIIDIKKTISDEERKTGIKSIEKPDPKTRISDVAWCNEQWVYDTIWPYMQQANYDAGWRYIIEGAESAQITRYKKGGFYKLHRDGMGDYLSAHQRGHVRKLSMTVLLNDSYEGGEFEFAAYSKEQCVIATPEFHKVGSIVVFPSGVEHRICPVTKGTRYSLVVWFLGPPFV